MANAHRTEGAGKTRDLETLTSNMRKALTWSDIDRDIATQPKVKLPDRRFLNLWNSYDLSQFRAAEEDWQDWEAKKDEVTKRLETRQVARDRDTNMVDLGFVAEALSASEQRDRVMRQNQQNLDQQDARQREAMHQESMQALDQLARAHHAAEQRQRMSDEVLRRHVDMGDSVHQRDAQHDEQLQHPQYNEPAGRSQPGYGNAAAPQRPAWYLHAPARDEQRGYAAFIDGAH